MQNLHNLENIMYFISVNLDRSEPFTMDHHGVFSLHQRASLMTRKSCGRCDAGDWAASSLDAESTTSTRTNRDLRPRINRICPMTMFPYDFPYDVPMKQIIHFWPGLNIHTDQTQQGGCAKVRHLQWSGVSAMTPKTSRFYDLYIYTYTVRQHNVYIHIYIYTAYPMYVYIYNFYHVSAIF